MVSLGIATGYERRYGVLKRIGSTPLSRGGLLTAKTANVLLIELAQAAIIVVVGIALGWSTSAADLPAVVLLLVGTVAFAGHRDADGGHVARRGEPGARRTALFLRAAVPRRDGVPARAGSRPRSRTSPRRCPRPRWPSPCATCSRPRTRFPLGHVLVLLVWAIAAPIAAAFLFRWEE